MKLIFTALFCSLQLFVSSQIDGSKKGGPLSISNATADIATSYTYSACGLNYVQASLQLNQRTFTTTPLLGQLQPAMFSISGIPACVPIVKAFLYVGTVGDGSAINASLTNPAASTSLIPMTIVGADTSTCWGTEGTYNYRADVTSLISGNGNYTISGIPTSTTPGTTDANGATLFIIYRDPSQNYTGNIVIADGSNVMANGWGGGGTSTIAGFSVCGTPTLTSHFMILSDLEQSNNADVWFNIPFNTTPNYTLLAASQQVWNFVSDPGSPVLPGQTTVDYGFNPGADCAGLMMAGMYYQSACLTCFTTTPAPVTLTVTPATTTLCPATVSATTAGGSGNYTYSWSGTAQTGSVVTTLSSGIYTVTVSDDDNTCAAGSATVQVVSATLSLTAMPDPACPINASVMVTSGTGTYSYTWSGTAQTSSVATGLSLGVHTITAINACAMGSTTVLAARATVVLTATTDPGCSRTVSVAATGGTGPFTYTWTGPAQTGSVVTLLSAGPHTITTLNSCSTGSTVVIVTPEQMTMTAVADATCGATASITALGGSGTTTYTWTGTGSGLTTTVATGLSAGVHTITSTNDCAIGSTTILITPDPMTITATPNPTCGGTASVVAVGGSGTNTYSWTPAGNGLNTAVASALAAGVHTITIKNLCAAGSETILITPNPMTVTATPNPTCGGTASVAVTGGSGTNTYTWSAAGNNLNSVTATALSPGVHTVSAKNNCAAGSTTVMITPNPMTITATPNSTCGTTATLTIIGGSGTNSYSWSPTGSSLTSSVATNLSPGVHTVTVRNTCAAGTETVLITPTDMTLTVIPSSTCATKASVVAIGGSGAITYSWTGGGNNLNTASATALSAGVHTITTRNNCAAGSETVLITPVTITLSLASNSIACPASTTVTAVPGITAGIVNGPFSYTWTSQTNSQVVNSSATSNTIVTNLGTGIYTLVARDNDRCATGSTTITIAALANTIAISNPTTICMGASVALVASGPAAASYTWSPAVNLSAANGSVVSVIAQPVSSVIYTVSYRTSTVMSGCANSQTTEVIVTPTLTLVPNNTAICEGLPLLINPAYTGTNYVWQGPNGYSGAAPTVTFAGSSPSLSGVYNTTITTAAGCEVYSANNVTVFSAPTPTISSNSPICAGSSLSLTSTGGSAFYSWSGPGGVSSQMQNPVFPNAPVSFSGLYFLNITYTNNCTKTAGLTTTVNPIPQPVITSNSPVCQTNTLFLNVSGGSTYQWTGPNGFNSSLATNSITNVPVTASGVYTVVASLASCTIAATQTVVIYPQPTINPTSNSPVCERGSLQLMSGTSGAVYLWTGPNSFTSNLQNPVISTVQLGQNGSYTLTVSGLTGNCPATTSVITVSVLTTPSVSATGATVCLGASATLTATGATSYNWSGPSGFSASGPTVLIPAVSSAGIYTVTGTALSPCAGTAIVNVFTKPLPPVSASGATVCEGQPVTLSGTGAASYNWSGPSGFTSNSMSIVFQPATVQNSGAYTVIGTGANSCSNSAVATLSVIPVPQLVIVSTPSVICIGESATLTANGAQTYTWLPVSISNNNPVRVVSPLVTTLFTLLGSNMGICSSSTSYTVQVRNCNDVGFNELSESEAGILIYPNPSSGDIKIRSGKDLELTMINELGQAVRFIRLNQENDWHASVTGLAYGVYYLMSPGQTFSQKIIIAPN